ncbi:MAG: hypothetical protein IJG52_02385 [Lachnospiraceae bacterium]|nr:hypothetical protein [Lachnospiraceae bacterium]
MGRRKNNPGLVRELIERIWTMDDDEFQTKYESLSSSDMSKVANAIDHMGDKWTKDSSEPEGCVTCGNYDIMYPDCLDSCPMGDD